MSTEGPLGDPVPAGTLLGRYRVLRLLAEGGMAMVYEAEHVDLQRRVALKAMKAGYALDPTLVQRFVLEARAASRLQHPNVVRVTDVGVESGRAFMVMDLLEGEDMNALLQRSGPLPVSRVVDVLLPIVSAVAAAHAEGIVHRDVKPENIFLARAAHDREHPVLLDFGISRQRSVRGPVLTRVGETIGTPQYMSPEQLAGDRELDGRSDEYALGVVLYQCTTGTVPFEASTLAALLARMLQERPDPPSARRPGLAGGFDAVVLRAIAARREDRYPSVRELGRALWPFASPRVRAVWAEEFGRPSTVRPLDAGQGARPLQLAPTLPAVGQAAAANVTIADLRAQGLLPGCSDDGLETLLQRTCAFAFAAGTEIVAEGAHAHGAYLVASGQVDVVKKAAGTRFRLGVLRSGDLFGHVALIERGPRVASVVAASDVVVLEIGGDTFEEMMGATDEASQALRSLVAVSGIRQLRRATRRLAALLDREGGAASMQEWLYLQSAVGEWSLPIRDES